MYYVALDISSEAGDCRSAQKIVCMRRFRYFEEIFPRSAQEVRRNTYECVRVCTVVHTAQEYVIVRKSAQESARVDKGTQKSARVLHDPIQHQKIVLLLRTYE